MHMTENCNYSLVTAIITFLKMAEFGCLYNEQELHAQTITSSTLMIKICHISDIYLFLLFDTFSCQKPPSLSIKRDLIIYL